MVIGSFAVALSVLLHCICFIMDGHRQFCCGSVCVAALYMLPLWMVIGSFAVALSVIAALYMLHYGWS